MNKKFNIPLIVIAIVLAVALIYVSQNKGIFSPITNPTSTPPVTGELKEVVPLGSASAKVLLEVYSDYQCPFCGQYYVTSLRSLITDYVNTGKVRLQYHELTFEDGASNGRSLWAAEGARCANEQGKFWEFHDKILTERYNKNDTNVYEKSSLKQYAKDLGLETTAFNNCLDSDKYANVIHDSTQAASAKGIKGMPTSYINGVEVQNSKGESLGAMPYDMLKQYIDAALNK